MLSISYVNFPTGNNLRQFYFLTERKLVKLCKKIKLAKCKNGTE